MCKKVSMCVMCPIAPRVARDYPPIPPPYSLRIACV